MRYIFQYYNDNLLNILGYNLLIVAPLWLLFVNYSFSFSTLDLNGVENLLVLFWEVLLVVIFIRPLCLIYERASIDEEIDFKEILKGFITSIGPILFLSLAFLLFSFLGLGLLILPGVLLLPIALLLPFTYDPALTLKNYMKKTIKFYKENLVLVWTLLVFWVSGLTLVWSGVLYLTSFLEMDILAFNAVRLLFIAITLPILVFTVCEKIATIDEGRGRHA